MNREELERAGINYQEGLKRFSGKAKLYEDFLARLPEEKTYVELREAMQKEDYEAAFRAAHTIKGIVGNLSVNQFLEEWKPFVDMLREEKDIPEAKALWPHLEEEYQKVITVIRGA